MNKDYKAVRTEGFSEDVPLSRGELGAEIVICRLLVDFLSSGLGGLVVLANDFLKPTKFLLKSVAGTSPINIKFCTATKLSKKLSITLCDKLISTIDMVLVYAPVTDDTPVTEDTASEEKLDREDKKLPREKLAPLESTVSEGKELCKPFNTDSVSKFVSRKF